MIDLSPSIEMVEGKLYRVLDRYFLDDEGQPYLHSQEIPELGIIRYGPAGNWEDIEG